MRVKPAAKGIVMLSLTGRGRSSMAVAVAAAANASWGGTKKAAPTKANANSAAVPSGVLLLLKGKGLFVIWPPMIEAALSPNAKAAMAA